jgi:hypothetical protein
MRIRRFFLLGLVGLGLVGIAIAAGRVQGETISPQNDLVVHEWGTFLAMQGSDGVSLDGMYHEEHALPAFVHARSRDQLRLPTVILKGETPVIYFYTARPQPVTVSVEFPRGIWTQWYPQARTVAPALAAPGLPERLHDGRITWSVDLIPDNASESGGPGVPSTAKGSLWNFARQVDAVRVRSIDRTKKPEQSDFERFIFYRGLGQSTLPLEVTMRDGGTLTAPVTLKAELKHLFVLRVEHGKGTWRYVPALRPGETKSGVIPSMADAFPLDQFNGQVGELLAAKLEECGLFAKEARAMVNTWRTSYFNSDGIRVLFVLPQIWTNVQIPLSVYPLPQKIVRVMVGRLEALTPEREQQAERAVRDLASPNAGIRAAAFKTLRDQGRYVEPIIRRVLKTTNDAGVEALCRRLLLTDFVTELRTAVETAANGGRLREEPVFVRARLASLLRDVGLDAEAKKEAEQIRPALKAMKAPPMTHDSARHYLRAYARTMEGLGDEEGATEWYGKFVRFGSQVSSGNFFQCGQCHNGTEAPLKMNWFADWWVGDRFGRHARASGRIDALIAEQETALHVDPKDAAAHLLLAYLYKAQGQSARATRQWEQLGVFTSGSQPVAQDTRARIAK